MSVLSFRRLLSQVCFATIFAAWVARGHYRRCWMFGPYLVAVWAGDAIPLRFPSIYTWDFWAAKEGLIAALKLLLAFELYLRLFAGLPGARRLANLPLLGLLVLTLGMLGKPKLHTDSVALYVAIVPPATVGITLVLTLVLGLATLFRVPVGSVHRAILRGLVPFQLVNQFGMQAFATFGFDAQPLYNAFVPVAYDVLLMYWAVMFWRQQEEDAAPPAVVHRLRAWASS